MYKKAFITGLSGQDGSLLANFLLLKGYVVYGIVRSKESNIDKLQTLKIEKKVNIFYADICDFIKVEELLLMIKPDEIYHLASQSSVFKSINNPLETHLTNYISTLNILEIIRKNSLSSKVMVAGSCEMFADSKESLNEDSLIAPINPYGVSKAASFLLVRNYRQYYGISAASAILFNHESYLREDHFFLKKAIKSALELKRGNLTSISFGDLSLYRDFDSAEDYIEAMWLILNSESPDDYCVCSGNSLMLSELVFYIFQKLNLDKRKLVFDQALFRANEIKFIKGDNSKLISRLNWKVKKNIFIVIDEMIEYEENKMAE